MSLGKLKHSVMLHTMVPVLSKEVRLILRGRRALLSLFLLLAALSAGFVMFWLAGGVQGSLGSRTALSRSIFVGLSAVQFFVFTFLIPSMAAASVAAEREGKTFDLLYVTAIPRLQLLFAKWASAAIYQVLVMLLILPILSLVFQLGGVGLDEYVAATIILLEIGLTYAMLGLAVSCWVRRTFVALAVTLLIIAALFAFIPIGVAVVSDLADLHDMIGDPLAPHGMLGNLLWGISPLTSLLEVFYSLLNGTAPAVGSLLKSRVFLNHLGIQGAIFGVATWLAWRNLSRGETDRSAVARRIIDDASILERRRKRWPYYLIDPLRRQQSIGDRQNPVYIKETRTGSSVKPQALARLTYCAVAVSIFVGLGDWSVERTSESAAFLTGVAVAIVMIAAPILSAISFPREREAKTLELLQSTTLTSRQIVTGKYRAILPFLGMLCAGLLFFPMLLRLCLGPMIGYNSNWWDKGLYSSLTFLMVLPTTASYVFFYASLGLMISTFSRRSVPAIAVTYLTFAGLAIAPFLMTGILYLLGYTHTGLYDRHLGLDMRILEVSRNLLGPLVSPFYYLQGRFEGLRELGPHYFGNPRRYSLAFLHSLLVLLLTGVFLRISQWRLSQPQDA